MLKNVLDLEQKAFDEMPNVEAKAAKLIKEGKTDEAQSQLTAYTKSFAATTVQQWKEMEIRFWEMFGRGF